MKKLLSFIVVMSFTTFTSTAQGLSNASSLSERLINDSEVYLPRTKVSDDIHSRGLTSLNAPKETIIDSSILLYPNPSSELLNISFNSNLQTNVKIEIIDILGKTVMEEIFTAQIGNNVRSLFINRLKNGLYYVNIKNENGTSTPTQRFTKN